MRDTEVLDTGVLDTEALPSFEARYTIPPVETIHDSPDEIRKRIETLRGYIKSNTKYIISSERRIADTRQMNSRLRKEIRELKAQAQAAAK